MIIPIDLGGVNVYLIKQEDYFMLCDTGGHLFLDKIFDNRREKLEKALLDHGCCENNLKLICLTHGDNDHVANAAYIREKYHAKIAMHADDAILVDHPTEEVVFGNLHYSSPLLTAVFVVMKKPIQKVMAKTLAAFESFQPDIYLKDNDELSEFGFSAKILHLPGHTKGSIGILTENSLICGDTFTNMKKPTMAPNAADFHVLKQSIQDLKNFPIQKVYPGHGAPFAFREIVK